MKPNSIDLFRYHNLTDRLSVFATDGGTLIRGSSDDVRIQDAEPEMLPGEQEVARVAGAVRLFGPCTTSESAEPSLGLVLEAATTVVVTTERLIFMAISGQSLLGKIEQGEEIHIVVWPWDLIDVISMPAKTRLSDRLAGGRTIELFSALTMATFKIVPRWQEVNDCTMKTSAEDVFALLSSTAAANRLNFGDSSGRDRLTEITAARFARNGNELEANITDPETVGVPEHLVGRLVEPDSEK